VCWSIVVQEAPTVDSQIFGAFPSDRIPKAKKEVNVHFFIHGGIFCKLYQSIPETCHIIYHTIYHIISCHVMSCHVMSCHVMSCHVMSCHASYIIYHITYILYLSYINL
jgi:hypothetical protein